MYIDLPFFCNKMHKMKILLADHFLAPQSSTKENVLLVCRAKDYNTRTKGRSWLEIEYPDPSQKIPIKKRLNHDDTKLPHFSYLVKSEHQSWTPITGSSRSC